MKTAKVTMDIEYDDTQTGSSGIEMALTDILNSHGDNIYQVSNVEVVDEQ